MFSKAVKHALVETEVSMTELAERLGCTKQNVSTMLRGKNITEANMKKIAEALDCDLKVEFVPKKSAY